MTGDARHTERAGPRRRVYVVEPDPAERARVVALLEAAGYAVTAVATLEAAATCAFWDGRPARVLLATLPPPPPAPPSAPGNY